MSSFRLPYVASSSKAWLITIAVFWFFNTFFSNLLLTQVQQHTVLEKPYTSFFLTHFTNDGLDSWLTMNEAIQYIAQYPDSLLYQHIFFDEKVKFQYPPTSLIFLEPFQSLTFAQMLSVLNFLGWVSVWLIGYLSYRIFLIVYRGSQPHSNLPRSERLLWLILFLGFTLTFYPFMRSWRLGQTQTFLILLFTAALYCFMTERKGWAGIAIGLICAVKPPLALLAMWGLFRKQWLFVIGMVSMGILILGLSLYWYGWHNHIDYLSVLSYIGKRGEVYYPNQTVNGLLNRLLDNGSSVVWTPNEFPPYHPMVYFTTLLTSFGLIAGAIVLGIKSGATHPRILLLDFFIASISFTLAAPVAWEHHYGIIFPMIATLLALNFRRKPARWEWGLLAVSYFLLSNLFEITLRWPDSPGNIMQSYVFFSVALLLGYFYWMRRMLYKSYISQPDATNKDTANAISPT
ncbi:MAG: glycosyltransferase family 87 protein [Cyclobacteriaceae bacterium]